MWLTHEYRAEGVILPIDFYMCKSKIAQLQIYIKLPPQPAYHMQFHVILDELWFAKLFHIAKTNSRNATAT